MTLSVFLVRNLTLAVSPIFAALLASVFIDPDLIFAAPFVVLATITIGLVSYMRNPTGQWWLHSLVAGFAGAAIGVALLFYIGSQI
ncbi:MULTISPECIES: hypothetical protein [unclassified Sphingopyxis]|uniref:hypothetical protein n=1 Tax=unclassified Sphingopyxis TaxID=2614943 RepID=UPI0024AE0228|nr:MULTISPECIES: hypothetical protein [unclassified Sphingopyxis]